MYVSKNLGEKKIYRANLKKIAKILENLTKLLNRKFSSKKKKKKKKKNLFFPFDHFHWSFTILVNLPNHIYTSKTFSSLEIRKKEKGKKNNNKSDHQIQQFHWP
jgi:hypothetical protein